MAKLTVLVFMAADNNLDLFATQDIIEMKKVGSTDNLNIIIQLDRRRAFLNEDEDTKFHTKRYFVQQNNLLEINDLGETNTGDPNVLKNFIIWGSGAYPAEAYLLIIWNHGGGVKDSDIYGRFGRKMKRPLFGNNYSGGTHKVRWICSDDTSRDFLDMNELKEATNVGFPLCCIAFDACLMAGFEIMYQLKDIALYIIGSEDVEPQEGWNYSDVLSCCEDIASNPSSVLNRIAKSFIDTFYTTDKNITQSAITTQNIVELGKSISSLANYLLRNFDDNELYIYRTLRNVQRFRDNDYIDLIHFVTLLSKETNSLELKNICNSIISISKEVIIANQYHGDDVKNSYGISILFPKSKLTESTKSIYSGLDYSIEYPSWLKLIQKL